MKRAPAIAAILLAGHFGFAQQTSPAVDYIPANLDHALTAPMTIDAHDIPLDQVVDLLRLQTHTNIVPNWPALARAGITKDTPVDLHLKDIPFEQIVKTLL